MTNQLKVILVRLQQQPGKDASKCEISNCHFYLMLPYIGYYSSYTASTYSQLKIKESFHIEQLKPELNKQVEHVSLSLVYLLLFTGSFKFTFSAISFLSLSFYWLV